MFGLKEHSSNSLLIRFSLAFSIFYSAK